MRKFENSYFKIFLDSAFPQHTNTEKMDDFLHQFSNDNLIELVGHLSGTEFGRLECCSKDLMERLRPKTLWFYRSLCLKSSSWFLVGNQVGDQSQFQFTSTQWLAHYLHMVRSTSTTHSSVLAVGGSTNRNPGHHNPDDGEDSCQWLNTCEHIAPVPQRTGPSMHECRDACAVTRDPTTHTLWISGGWNGQSCHRSLEYLSSQDSATHWSLSQETLLEPRCFHAAVFDREHGHLVLGGSNHLFQGAVVSRTVEQPSAHMMFPASMLYRRTGHLGSLHPDTRQLIVCGGYGGNVEGSEMYHETVEMLDMNRPEEKGFVKLPNMTTKKTGFGGGFGPDGCLYVVGGSTNGSDGLSVVEKLDLREKKWTRMANLKVGRGYTGAAWGLDGALYCCGGSILAPQPFEDNGQQFIVEQQQTFSSVERYDYRMNKWEILQEKLSVERADHCMITRLFISDASRLALARRMNPVEDVWQSRRMRTL